MKKWLPKASVVDVITIINIFFSIKLLIIEEYLAVLIFGAFILLNLLLIKYLRMDI